MKTVLFNRFFYPDSSATSQMVSDLAFELAARGYDVHVVASLSNPELPARENVRGVTVHRVGRAKNPRSLALKALDYARYYVGARAVAERILQNGDIAVVKTDPPMLAAAIGPIVKRHGARLVNWLQDVFPEIAMEYGIPGTRSSALANLRNRWLQRADLCVVIGDTMKSRIVTVAHLSPTRVEVIPNWARGSEIFPIESTASKLRADWGLREAFVVGYSGNLGRVHEFDTILAAAERLRGETDVRFLIVGSGPQLQAVAAQVRTRGLGNVQLHPPQPRALLTESLGLADVHLCVLRPEFEGLVVPSKMYGIMAAGRPQIYIGDVSADPARLLNHHQAGLAVAKGDAQGLAHAILSLRSDVALRRNMGRNARTLFDREFDFPIAARKWIAVLDSLS